MLHAALRTALRAVLATCLVLAVALATLPAAPAAADVAVRYQPPVGGHVLRRFEPPDGPYGAGHRGVDLAAARGTPVHAAAGGHVRFAGRVAGRWWVTLEHADGVRTSVGDLEAVVVARGDDVARGDRLGTAAGGHGGAGLSGPPDPGLHWSARRGDTYLDPLTLLTGAEPVPTLVGPGGWRGTDPVVETYAPYPGGSRFGVLAPASPVADRPGFALPPNGHHLVQVPGFATEGPSPVLDPSYLGYDPEDSSTFSYAGCVPTGYGCAPRPHGGTDTHVDVEAAARQLREHLRALQAAQPHRPVDLLGHSMGGDVAATYLEQLHDPDDPTLPPIGRLVTIATPHGGSGLARLGRALGDDLVVAPVAEGLRAGLEASGVDLAGRLHLDAPALERYGGADRGGLPDRDLERLTELGVEHLWIAGSRDPVVDPSDAAPDGGGRATILPGGHGSVAGSEAAYRAVHDFLAGRPVTGAEGPLVGQGSRELDSIAGVLADGFEVWGLVTTGRKLARREPLLPQDLLDADDLDPVLDERTWPRLDGRRVP